MSEIVWLKTDRRYAVLINMGAFYSDVHYIENGIDYTTQVETDDIDLISYHEYEYEDDELE